jgi:glycosyltransferase involved in cell wall biosynthesis
MGYQENHLARVQAGSGHAVTVITSSRMSPWPAVPESVVAQGDAVLLREGINVLRLPCRFEHRSRVILKGLSQALRTARPDVVHVHSFSSPNAIVAARSKRELGYRLIIDDHMLFVASKALLAPLVHWIMRRGITDYIASRADRIVAVTKETAEYMALKYGVPPGRLSTIPLGVDTGVFHPSAELRLNTRRALSIPEDKVLCVCTGKMDKMKNPILALKAAHKLWKRGLKFHLMFIGAAEPAYEETMRDYVRKHSLEASTSIEPPVPARHLAGIFNAADLAVWATNCSMSSLEAMACGSPVIVPDLPANLERLEGGGGLAFPDGDMDRLCETMRELIQDPDRRRAIGDSACAYAREFDWHVINEKIMDGLYSSDMEPAT